jgi:hypothetical protein
MFCRQKLRDVLSTPEVYLFPIVTPLFADTSSIKKQPAYVKALDVEILCARFRDLAFTERAVHAALHPRGHGPPW